jgi:hypothetical protein
MSRTVAILLAATLGLLSSALVLPISEANATVCAKKPKMGSSTGDCRRYQCLNTGPCSAGGVFFKHGCLRYLCTVMVPAGGEAPGKGDQTVPVPVPPGGPTPPR